MVLASGRYRNLPQLGRPSDYSRHSLSISRLKKGRKDGRREGRKGGRKKGRK